MVFTREKNEYENPLKLYVRIKHDIAGCIVSDVKLFLLFYFYYFFCGNNDYDLEYIALKQIWRRMF